MTTPHICLIGRAGAGKTTAAELLVKHFDYERLSFAAPLKVGCGTSTDRTLLQDVGQGVRDLHEDFWVNLLIEDFTRRTHELDAGAHCHCVVDDCRFPNEAQRLCVEGFVIVRVNAPKLERVVRLKANGKLQSEDQLDHISETALDNYITHYVVHNFGPPDDLLDDLTAILNREQRP